jgi:hypothetical protein
MPQTVNATEVFLNTENQWIQPAMRDLIEHDLPRGVLIPLAQKFTIPTTALNEASDILRLFKFPAGAYIWDFRSTPSDLDSDGTPALTYSILTTDDSDVTKVTLVLASTNGQAAAGSDRILSAAVGRYVGNQWLAFKVGTAADVAVAGTLKIALLMTIGVVNRTKRGLFFGDAEA